MQGPSANLLTWPERHRKLAWLILLGLASAVLVLVLTPIFLIMPFKAQTIRSMELSYGFRRWSPWLTLAALVPILWLLANLWRSGRWWGRIVLVILLVPVFAATWMARQNHFEWMFNPLPNPVYARVADANFVTDQDRVMTVQLNGEAVAYPIRWLAYHHVVQDVVGGTPVCVTY
jgi:hypothetical protein